jgi:transposase
MDLAQELVNSNLPAAVRAAILAQSALLTQQDQQLKQYVSDIQNKTQTIEVLTMEISYLRRMRYGAKTEVMNS